MEKTTSPIARVLAVVALLAAVVLVFSAITGSSDDDGGTKSKGNRVVKKNDQAGDKKAKPKRQAYVVKDGDTLTGIAAANGVSVDTIQELNPELDPQALIAGQKLKLR